MGRAEFIRRLTDLLAAAGISYMITGSVGSAYHGRGRATFDIDVIIETDRGRLLNFVENLWGGCYASAQAAQDAFDHESMFNVIDSNEGWKADLIIRKSRPFSQVEFERRGRAVIDGVEVSLVSVEDTILSKLEWSKTSESQMQHDDALCVAVEQFEALDREYLSKWAGELGVSDELERLLEEAESIRGGGKTGL